MTPSASQKEITKAYRRLAARYHPDKHQGNELQDLAEEKLAELNEAYNVLSDPTRRAGYDRERGQAPPPNQAGAPPGTPPGTPSGTPSEVPPAAFPLSRILSLLGLVALLIFGMRFLRSPRINLLLGILLFILWFGPRLYRRFRGPK